MAGGRRDLLADRTLRLVGHWDDDHSPDAGDAALLAGDRDRGSELSACRTVTTKVTGAQVALLPRCVVKLPPLAAFDELAAPFVR